MSAPDPDADRHSVFNEPSFKAENEPADAQTDRFCLACGYSLRSVAGTQCPECGHRIGDVPPAPFDNDQNRERDAAVHSVTNELPIFPEPQAESRYSEWLTERIAETPGIYGWLTALGIALVGGVWAVLGAIISGAGGVAGIVIVGPVSEEVMKIALVVIVIETKPHLFSNRLQLFMAAAASALGFAVIENLVYLNVYIDEPSSTLASWRWSVCTALHVGCTIIAALGAARMWRRAIDALRPAVISDALPAVMTAAVVHGAYNGFCVLLEVAKFQF